MCQTARDGCVSSTADDCHCYGGGDVRICDRGTGGACGRPFLVADAARVAPLGTDLEGWSELRPDGRLERSFAEQEALARRWSRIAQLEHASIAAFARFTLELLALGAPAELVAESARAQADEILHARIAFGFASAHAGVSIGPEPLEVGDCLGASSLVSVARTTFLEGCIGELTAALEAREFAGNTQDPVEREAWALIAEDESRHAALAWRFLKWAFEQSPESLAEELSQILRRERGKIARADDGSPRNAEDDLRAMVLQGIVEPALEELCARSTRTGLPRWRVESGAETELVSSASI
jgi:hypothetical protein